MNKRKRRTPATRSRHVRLTDNIWQQVIWYADHKGLALADALRVLIGDAVRDTKPPHTAKVLCPKANADEWELWEQAAKLRSQSVDELARESLNYTAARIVAKSA